MTDVVRIVTHHAVPTGVAYVIRDVKLDATGRMTVGEAVKILLSDKGDTDG